MKQITTDDLRRMQSQEGLILQGCGGDLQEWLDGVNNELTEAGILLNGSRFTDISSFQRGGVTNLLLPFDSVWLDMGKLNVWRLRTHEQFGGTWLSDYVTNQLGGFIRDQKSKKPDCPLIGEDGNIFNLLGIAARTLRKSGLQEQAKEMQDRIMGGECHDYYAALNVIGEYVNITEKSEQDVQMEGGMALE